MLINKGLKNFNRRLFYSKYDKYRKKFWNMKNTSMIVE